MTGAPTIHLMVPAYGPSPYLGETLRSAVAALRPGVEITVVDDASPGPEVAAAADAQRDLVEYVRLEANQGVAGAFDACARMSRGDYTVIVGSDDLLEPWYVDEVRSLVNRFGRVELVMPGVTVIDGEGTPARPLADRVKGVLAARFRRPAVLRGEPIAASLLTGNWLYFPAIAWRTDALASRRFRTDMGTAMDLELELRVLFDGGGLAVSDCASFRYRRHDDSVSSRTAASGERFAEQDALFAWAVSECERLGWRRAALAGRVHATSRLHALLSRARG